MYSNIQGYGISGLAKVIKVKCKGPFRELTNVTLNYCSHNDIHMGITCYMFNTQNQGF